MKLKTNHSIEEGEYLQIKVRPDGNRLALELTFGVHLFGHPNTPDSTVVITMPDDFREELADVLRTVANRLESINE